MDIVETNTSCVVRWDTFSNKIYFNVEKGSLQGRLILRKDADGKIGMQIRRGQPGVWYQS